MSDDEVLERAAAAGFELEEELRGVGLVWAWRRGEDGRWPCFFEERLAVAWMADRLARQGVFE